VLLHLVGAVEEVFGYWHLGALHKIESEDLVCAVMRYACGATGVIQAATALWPGYPERYEIHGTKGSAIVTGDQLTTWDVQDDSGEPAPIGQQAKSGASDPMAISLTPFERQLGDFGEACKTGNPAASSGIEGYRALQLVRSIYDSCAEGRKIQIDPQAPLD
jgi:predicted dehydrogenase